MTIESLILMQLLPYLFISLTMRFILPAYGKNHLARIIVIPLVLIGAGIAASLFYKVGMQNKIAELELFTWLSFAGVQANWAIYIDSLSSLMLVIVTSVSAVVHIYSFGYMAKDKALNYFMGYLSLFTFFMLILVVSNNFLQLFVGWEGVGLCSYLLIGFWYKKESACAAANKAFIVNRVGDLALIVGISAIIYFTGTVDFIEIFARAALLSSYKMQILNIECTAVGFICLMLLLGAMGKSAQIGLHVWLPDAMEGPTPVSALIHAATMVTAGVFLIARCSPLFEYSTAIKTMTMLVGGITCIFAAITAIGQNDIKKIIAYSTCSQLGYMFLACGVGAYGAAIFHLFTHAFFKALLFLCAGNIIHAANHEQDIRKIYINPQKMPITFAMMWIGSLALCGIFPLAGYYSKDLILESVYLSEQTLSNIMFYIGLVAAFFTAAYSVKILTCVFSNAKKMKHEDHVHEAESIMNLPLAFLVLGAIVSGFLAVTYLNITDINGYFSNSITVFANNFHHGELPSIILYAPLIVAISGLIAGYIIYKYKLQTMLSKKLGIFYKLSANKFYFDEIYYLFITCPLMILSVILSYIDNRIIDKYGPGGFVKLSSITSNLVRKTQTGFIFNYALVMIIGLLAILVWTLNLFYQYQ